VDTFLPHLVIALRLVLCPIELELIEQPLASFSFYLEKNLAGSEFLQVSNSAR
jgi:hypothetical protein